jgi:hypothetical protein
MPLSSLVLSVILLFLLFGIGLSVRIAQYSFVCLQKHFPIETLARFKGKSYLCSRLLHQEWQCLPTNRPTIVGNGGKRM